MSYYYTIQEYASHKGFELSVQEEARAGERATRLSYERGVAINKVVSEPNKGRKTSCFPVRILREAFATMVGQEERALATR